MEVVFIVCLTCLWTSYYGILRQLFKKCSAEWISRIVALTHALLATKLVEVYMFLGSWPLAHVGETNSPFQTFVLCLSGAYFLFETGWCLYMKSEGPLMLLHHLISIASMLGCLYLKRGGSEVTATLWGSEITNPFLQIRWFLRQDNSYGSTFAVFNDWVFFLLFGLVRVGIGFQLVLSIYFSERTPTPLKLGGYVFYVIGLIWMYFIFKFAQKRLFVRNHVIDNEVDKEEVGEITERSFKIQAASLTKLSGSS